MTNNKNAGYKVNFTTKTLTICNLFLLDNRTGSQTGSLFFSLRLSTSP